MNSAVNNEYKMRRQYLERIMGNKMGILSQFHLVLRQIVARIFCEYLKKNIMTDNVPKPRYRKQCYLLKSFKIMS